MLLPLRNLLLVFSTLSWPSQTPRTTAAVILLHQQVAYSETDAVSTLPAQPSADICQEAAIVTATIIKKFLLGWPQEGPVSPQLGFCAFVSARVLLGRFPQTGDLKHDLYKLLTICYPTSARKIPQSAACP